MVGAHERAQMGRKLEYVWIPRIDNSGEGVGYFNMGSYGTTLFNALEIIIKFFFNQEKSELYVELIVSTSSLN